MAGKYPPPPATAPNHQDVRQTQQEATISLLIDRIEELESTLKKVLELCVSANTRRSFEVSTSSMISTVCEGLGNTSGVYNKLIDLTKP